MQLIRLTPHTPPYDRPTAIALGYFDGVHIGHQTLLSATVRKAAAAGWTAAVFCFSDTGSHYKPTSVRLMDLTTKLDIMAGLGIQTAFVADFDTLSAFSPARFVREILRGICRAEEAFCGFNYRFGQGAAGDSAALTALMQQAGGGTTVLAPCHINRQPVSSTAIRAAVTAGDMPAAAAMLGRPFFICLPVRQGQALGRTLGIPTINQHFPPGFVVPKPGVYHCFCEIGGQTYPAVTNVGVRPTVQSDGRVICESHLLGFAGDLYDRQVRVSFLRRLRDEQKFPTTEELKQQIKQDIEEVQTWHKRNGPN